MVKYFFDDWENKTQIELRAIEVFKKGLKIIQKEIPSEEIISIYIKGSFLNRELREKSDINFVTILKTAKYAKKLKELGQQYRRYFQMELQIDPCYTLYELKTGKRRKVLPPSQHPGTFVNRLNSLQLVYGKELDQLKFKGREYASEIKGLVGVMQREFIPEILKKENGEDHRADISISSIVKATLWLADSELRLAGVPHGHSYKEIVEAIKDKKHVAYQAYNLRVHPTKDKKTRENFIKNLEEHLRILSKTYN